MPYITTTNQEHPVNIPLDLVSSEIGATYRADADQAAMRSVARLAKREQRMHRRMDRAYGRLAGRIGR